MKEFKAYYSRLCLEQIKLIFCFVDPVGLHSYFSGKINNSSTND